MEKVAEINGGLNKTECMEPHRESEMNEEKDEFRQVREDWKKEEREYKRMGLESAEEVIDAIMKAREAAEKAAVHMDGRALDGESEAHLVMQSVKPNSIRAFLQMLSMVGMEEDQKKRRRRQEKARIKNLYS